MMKTKRPYLKCTQMAAAVAAIHTDMYRIIRDLKSTGPVINSVLATELNNIAG